MRIVIKIGSSILSEKGRVSNNRIKEIVNLVADIKNNDDEVILVSSGAVSTGYSILHLDKKVISNRQALAAIGQPMLLNMYQDAFSEYGIISSQILLSSDVFNRTRDTVHAKNAVDTLLNNGVVPIMNENDTVSIDELVFGDNDMLSAHVSHYFEADLLVILSDVSGYYDDNPLINEDANMVSFVGEISDEELSLEVSPGSEFGTGGIATKLAAADFLMKKGEMMYLASGFELSNIRDFLLEKKQTGGTLFKAYEQ